MRPRVQQEKEEEAKRLCRRAQRRECTDLDADDGGQREDMVVILRRYGVWLRSGEPVRKPRI